MVHALSRPRCVLKILYGVVGEGMGHAIRSSVVIDKLLADGHEVHIVVSGRAFDFLKQRFPQVSQIWGLTMVMEDNELKNRLTALQNLRGALEGWPDNVRQYFEVESEFEPDLVISDFESFSWMFAKLQRVPVICVDNIQIINRCTHSDAIIAGDAKEFHVARSVIKAKTPAADHYFITSFFEPPVRKKRTTLVPPILRDEILAATPTDGEHVLVYQTSESFGDLPEILSRIDREFIIYGLRRDLTEDVREGNLTFRPFSTTGFVDDLASCAGVIASAGFTLMGEALHLHKPYLATPVRKQFEQLLNARYLEDMGLGMYDETLDEQMIRAFLDRLPQFKEALASYPQRDNSALFAHLDDVLDRVGAGMDV